MKFGLAFICIVALGFSLSAQSQTNTPSPKAEPPKTAAKGPGEKGEATSTTKESAAKKRERFRYCYCARPRLFRTTDEALLNRESALSAWTEPGRTEFEAFRRTKDEQGARTASVPAPFETQVFDVAPFGEVVASRSRLSKAVATSYYDEPFLMGLMNAKRQQPIDLVRARIDVAPGEAYSGVPSEKPRLKALYLSDYKERNIPSCGESNTRRVHYVLDEKSPEIAGFLVQDDQGRAALLDERHVRSFGIGRVGPCEQGVEIPQSGTYSLTPVGWDFSLGDKVTFDATKVGAFPTITSAPPSLERSDDENPFVHPPNDPIVDILSDDRDTVALGAMLFVMFAAVIGAGFLRQAIRNRKHMVDVECPACNESLSLNAKDPSTDGMFCPKCGESSMFVTFEPDGSPRVRAFALTKEEAQKSEGTNDAK